MENHPQGFYKYGSLPLSNLGQNILFLKVDYWYTQLHEVFAGIMNPLKNLDESSY